MRKRIFVSMTAVLLLVMGGLGAASWSKEGDEKKPEEKALAQTAEALSTVFNQGEPVPLANHEHLKDLEWMIGEWARTDKDVEVRIVCSWKANKNFMSRFFTVKVKGEITHQGSQMVGWDPIQKRIRSWVFESDGTFGEGVWQRDGDRWTIKATGVLPEGKRTTATQVITKIDADQYRWQSLARAVDGSILPNTEETILTRLSNKGKE